MAMFLILSFAIGSFAGDIEEYAMISEALRKSPAWVDHYGPLLRADLGTDLRMSQRVYSMVSEQRQTMKQEKSAKATEVSFPCWEISAYI